MNSLLIRHVINELISEYMKKLTLIAVLVLSFTIVSGQRSIDRLFEKYSDRDGFTSVNISGNLLTLAASFDEEHGRDVKARITGVRILAQKQGYDSDLNFHDLVKRDLDFNGYEEFMRVKESDQDLRMLVRYQGRRITEVLVVAGGEDNAIIQVKGDMSVSDARRLSGQIKKNRNTGFFDEEL
jgi:hypothetical protein